MKNAKGAAKKTGKDEFEGGYGAGDTARISIGDSACDYHVIDVQKPKSGPGYVILTRKKSIS